MPEYHRVHRADVLDDFKAQLQKSGGSERIHAKAIEAETRELFGCDTTSLYKGVGGKEGDRDTLPRSAQKAYMHNEIDCTQQLKRQGRQPGTQRQRDHKIVNDVRKASRKNKRLWEWNQ